MATDADLSECFARATFPDDESSHGWNRIQLEQCAQSQHEAIVQGVSAYRYALERLRYLGRVLGVDDARNTSGTPIQEQIPKGPAGLDDLTCQESTRVGVIHEALSSEVNKEVDHGQAKE